MILLIDIGVSGQSKISSSYTDGNDINFIITSQVDLYNTKDSIMILYGIHNNSNVAIYVFDPLRWAFVNYQENTCEVFYELGANFIYNFGFINYFKLIRIDAHSKYQVELKYNIPDSISHNHKCISLGIWDDPSSIRYMNVSFNIGYYVDDGKIDIIQNKEKHITQFRTGEAADEFMGKLLRFNLGPLRFRLIIK